LDNLTYWENVQTLFKDAEIYSLTWTSQNMKTFFVRQHSQDKKKFYDKLLNFVNLPGTIKNNYLGAEE